MPRPSDVGSRIGGEGADARPIEPESSGPNSGGEHTKPDEREAEQLARDATQESAAR
jgi:hypothetical protein